MPDSVSATTTEAATHPSVTLVDPKDLGYSKLYLDQIAGRTPAIEFYPTRTMEQAVEAVDRAQYDRAALQEILRQQNQVYAADEQAITAIERLVDPKAVCVFAGQQAGFVGGPFLTLTKALGIVKAARLYEKQLGRPVVPVFWIAGDDHDFAEANHTYVLRRAGEVCRNAYQTAPEHPWPMSDVRFCDRDELTRVKKQLLECLGQTDFTDCLFEVIDHAYTPSDTFVTAFGRFMAGLTRETGLVFFNPGDVAAKRLAMPLFKRIAENQEEIHRLVGERNAAIEAAGYHIQVEKRDDASHLFYHVNGRQAIYRDNGGFVVNDERWSQGQLVERIEAEPEKFSPDVMLRPVLQSYLFPVVSQKGGPAEIAYLAQLNPLFAALDVPAPLHKARPTFTVVETRFEKMLEEYRIEFAELTGDIEQVVNRVLAESFPPDLEADFTSLRETIQRQFEKIRAEALAFDKQLQKYSEQVQGKLDYTVKQLEGKVWSSHKKHNQQTRERIHRLHNALYTNRGLQERALNVTYFLARYGFGLIPYLFERFDSEETAHQLISLAEYHS